MMQEIVGQEKDLNRFLVDVQEELILITVQFCQGRIIAKI